MQETRERDGKNQLERNEGFSEWGRLKWVVSNNIEIYGQILIFTNLSSDHLIIYWTWEYLAMFDLLSRRVKARNIRFRISFRLLICTINPTNRLVCRPRMEYLAELRRQMWDFEQIFLPRTLSVDKSASQRELNDFIIYSNCSTNSRIARWQHILSTFL